jgi:hypothetical protein
MGKYDLFDDKSTENVSFWLYRSLARVCGRIKGGGDKCYIHCNKYQHSKPFAKHLDPVLVLYTEYYYC